MNESRGVPKIFQYGKSLAPKVFLLFGILVQIFWYIQLWGSLIKNVALNSIDFVSLYSAGIVAKTHGLVNTYDVNLQQITQRIIIGPDFVSTNTLRFNHPPYLLPFLVKISSENYSSSYIMWSVLLIIIVGLCMFFIVRTLITFGFSNKYALLMGVVGALYYPIFMSILKGQDSALLLLGLSIWVFALLIRKDYIAGMGLALATIKPQIAIMIAIPFIFRRRRVLRGFFLGSLMLFIYSVLLVGVDGMKDLVEIILLSAGGEDFGLNQNQMFNFLGLLLRTFPAIDLGFAINLSWGTYILSIISLCYLWQKSTDNIPYSYFGLAVVVSLFASPHLHFHDLSLLIIPAFLMTIIICRQRLISELWGVNLVLFSSLVMLVAGVLSTSWLFSVSYLIMLALVLGLSRVNTISSVENQVNGKG